MLIGTCDAKLFSRRSRNCSGIKRGERSAQVEPDQAVDLPTQDPFLRIDAGMHTAPIRRIGVDASCSLLATASEDKTIRLWRLPDGKLLNTLRPPIGDGNEGKVYAVAVAPDGGWVAAGGWTRTGGDHWIYIFQTATGAMATRLGPFRQVIANLVVSPDGRNLAATFWRGGGVRVWEREGAGLSIWKPVGEDAVYGGRDANGAAFAKTGALYTVADDGQLRRYAPNDFTARPKIAPTPGGKRPYSISINPKNNELAVGFADAASVEIYDATTLSYLFAAKGGGAGGAGGLNATAWSAGGERLFAGGIYARDEQHVIRIWDDAENASPRDLDGNADVIMNLLPCSDGVAVGAGNPAFGLLDARGVRRLWRDPIGADMRNKLGKDFMISVDGMRVRFGLGEGGEDPILFDLNMQHLIPSPQPPPDDLFPPETSALPIEGWQNAPTPKLAAERIRLDVNERSQSLAITPDRQQFVLGCDYYLRAYDKDGGLLWKPKQAPGVFWGVNVSRDGRLIVAAAGEGTVRWYRMDNGRELLALFVQRETREWVAWTPKGYFTASPRGAELVGWHVNRGWAQSADFFALSHFRDTFDRPDIVRRVLATLDEDTAIREANALIKKKRENEDITKSLPPVISITSWTSVPSSLSPGRKNVVIEYKVRSPSRLPVTRVVARVDSRPSAGAETANLTLDSNAEATGTFTVAVGPHDVAISVIAKSNDLAGTPAVLTVGPVQDGEQGTIKPKLYALVVGIGEYEKVHPKLSPIPENDADLLAQELATQKDNGGAFADVTIKLLRDAEATHANILNRLQWLAKAARDSETDIALVYFSGHGAVDKAGAYYSFGFRPDQNFQTGLYKRDILAFLRSIPGKVIFIVDACHAAADLEGTELLNSSSLVGEFSEQRNGITAFASSQGSELSGAAPGTAIAILPKYL